MVQATRHMAQRSTYTIIGRIYILPKSEHRLIDYCYEFRLSLPYMTVHTFLNCMEGNGW